MNKDVAAFQHFGRLHNHNLPQIQLLTEDAFLAIQRAGQNISEWGDDNAAPPAHFMGLINQFFKHFKVRGVHIFRDVLVAAQDETTAFTGDMLEGCRPCVPSVCSRCNIKLHAF